VANLVFFAICAAYLKMLGWKLHDSLEVGDLVGSVPIYPALACGAFLAVKELWDDRVKGTTWVSVWLLQFYVAKQLQSMIVLLYEMFMKPSFHTLLMALHHIISITCFCSGLIQKVAHFYGAFALVCESTTIFANNLTLLHSRDGMLKNKYPVLNILNGVGLWVSFIPFRLMLFPYWLYMFYQDWPDLQKALPVQVLYLYAATIVVLLALSTFWFGRITLGIIKAVKSLDEKKEE
jgi:hypothetical protein